MSAGQLTVPVTALQRAQMTQIGAHHGRHRLTCRLPQIGGSGSLRLLRSLISGISIRLVRVRSYDRPGRSIVTVLLETSM